MNYLIRRRTKEDISGIQKVVTTSWNETYKGIVPDWFLEELKTNEDERIKNIYDSFDENDNNQFVLEIDGQIAGFVNFGKKLVEAAKNELKNMGFNKMLIACLKGNPSNEFYKHIGGIYVKDGLYKRLQLKENVYYYEL